jgi:hypothetical protein
MSHRSARAKKAGRNPCLTSIDAPFEAMRNPEGCNA